MGRSKREILSSIEELVREYYSQVHGDGLGGTGEIRGGGKDAEIPYAGRVFGHEELNAAVRSSLDFWLTLGEQGEGFEREIASYLGVRFSRLVNSGSSANFLAVGALTSSSLPEGLRLVGGGEIITCAAGFPTTAAPILQHGGTVVFVDVDPVTCNVRLESLQEAYREGKTRGVILAHGMGNPFDIGGVLDFCRERGLVLIEDNCDALGSRYCLGGGGEGDGEMRLTGSWGDLSTQSFYPAHHITMGEGGLVSVRQDVRLMRIVESLRDWGRDCWCATGVSGTCGKRFGWSFDGLPDGYDHKYVYSHLGYNMKPTDWQAAIGRVQLSRLPEFIQARRSNWEYLRSGLDELQEVFEFGLPTHAVERIGDGEYRWDSSGSRSEPSWFGFMLLVRPNSGLDRVELARYLTERGIGNRMFFGGNLMRQPAFSDFAKEHPDRVRVVGDLQGADRLMRDGIFIGVYPGLRRSDLDLMIDTITRYVRGIGGRK